MSIASVAALLDALRQVPLLEPEQMAELARLSPGRFADARGLAGELVRRGWLTPYQVNQLFQGRGSQLVLGSFVLLERLGEGGMGQVFKARHRKLGRIVALKLIRKERLAHPDTVRRFRREIEAASKLTHPNIVLALDADEINDTHFFAMEYVEGSDLAKHVKRNGPLSVETACDFIRQAALGLQHAHECGMVHRDIKPHNLLLVSGTGAVKVLDMGLARLRSESREELSSTSLTAEGAVMGTPDYIAPEQALDSRSADIRADLYSLGCTFYFLLTGRVPFAGGTIMEKLFRHQTEPPRPLRDVRPDVSPPVAAVVHRLMAKRPADRFQTPAELIAALVAARAPQAAVATVPGSAASPDAQPRAMTPMPPHAPDTSPFADLRDDTVRMDGNTQRTEGAVERKRVVLFSAAGGGVLLAFVLLLVLLAKGGSKDRPNADNTPPHLSDSTRPDAGDKEWKALRARGEMSGADRAKLREDVLAFRSAYPGSRSAVEAAAWLMKLPSPLDRWKASPLTPWQKLEGQPKELLAVLGDHRGWIGASNPVRVQWGPDGRWLACNAGGGTIRLFNSADLTVKAILKAAEPQYVFDIRRDGKMLATGGFTNVVLWDVSGQQPRQIHILKGFPGRVGAVALSPDGKRLAVPCWTEPPTVRLWDLSGDPKEVAILKGHTNGICRPAFSPDSKTLATGSQDKTIRIWDLSGDEPKVRAVLKTHTYWVVSVTFSPDGKLLASSGQHDRTLRLWDMTLAEPKEWIVQADAGEATNEVAFSPDGKRLACGLWQGLWRMWDVSERQFRPLAFLPDHTEIVWSVSFSPDGRTLATASNDGTLHLWHVQDMPPRQRFVSPGHGQPISGLAFTPDDGTLVSMGRDGSVGLWNLKEPPSRPRAALPVPLGTICGSIRPDGRTLITGDPGNKLIFWDLEAGKELRSSSGHDKAVLAAAYSADGGSLVTAGADNTLKFWDGETGTLKLVEQVEQIVQTVTFSADGRWLAVGDGKGTVRVRRTRIDQSPVICAGPEECARVLAFHPDSKVLAAAGKDGRVRLYDVANGRERSSLPGHDKDITFVAFTPDGKQLISAGREGRIIVRESGNGRELQTIEVHLPICAAALAGDGRHLAVGHVDGTIYLLRLTDLPPATP